MSRPNVAIGLRLIFGKCLTGGAFSPENFEETHETHMFVPSNQGSYFGSFCQALCDVWIVASNCKSISLHSFLHAF